MLTHSLQVQLGSEGLPGELFIPPGAEGLVLIVHDSSGSRREPGHRKLAEALQSRDLCTLSFSLRTGDEEREHLPLPVDQAGERIVDVLDWLSRRPALAHWCVGLFGLQASAPGCLCAAQLQPQRIGALVLLDAWIDPQAPALAEVRAPSLLIVHARDADLVERQRAALRALRCEKQLELLPRAARPSAEVQHEAVAGLAVAWFAAHLCPPQRDGKKKAA